VEKGSRNSFVAVIRSRREGIFHGDPEVACPMGQIFAENAGATGGLRCSNNHVARK
jgi:hypothetical protein